MQPGQRFTGTWQRWHATRALVLLPIGLIVTITVVDIQTPESVHLGPLLVVAPAITVAIGGVWLTGLIGVVAVAAQVVIAVFHGGLTTPNHISQIIGLAILSTLAVIVCLVRDRRRAELAQVRSVSEAAQRALLRPLPRRLGTLHLSCTYLAAAKEARIGGDLYAVARTGDLTRVLIGDVRGKGLNAVGEAAALMGAFQEAAHQHATLPALAGALDRSACRYSTQFLGVDDEAEEHFITALLLEIPDHGCVARLTHCGHPPPLLISRGQVRSVRSPPAPPLGMCVLTRDVRTSHTFPFGAGDTLLMYTDGLVEARDSSGAFYPLEERLALWVRCHPDTLVECVQRDLLAHTGGALRDDAAILAIRRTAMAHAAYLGSELVGSDGRPMAELKHR
ncbi:PP2C family protein-serine/threonine phosphatase [Streptomyces echinatus]|uniref:Serine phosphatase RsbU (Regulator of sigma subunit) n=1 Tax=Streptomyces echinatus TaxID=67293 RepID=A0A7W9Q3D8_9ACTN|nr:PP2C family protein-serine/threonine phosphatase [Streptomyces echinatus]MBB5932830.1 serine phosphatase RsbU (regulator of sigma subunit) [Streptomyces echinatus]